MINRKIKQCNHPGCSRTVRMRGKCDSHYRMLYSKPLKRSPIQRSRKPIRQRSEKEKERLQRYYPIRDAFLERPENKYCQCKRPGCRRKATTVHHPEGREGNLLFDDSLFIALSLPCHRWVEDHPAEAYQMGLSRYRVRINH